MSDTAVATLVTGSITIIGMVVGFLTLWVKLKYGNDKADSVEKKIDANTKLTKDGTAAATLHAETAAIAASEAKDVAHSVDKKLNGGVTVAVAAAVAAAIAPIHVSLVEHMSQDTREMGDIKAALNTFVSESKMKEFSEYVHQRNHDMLGAMQTLTNRMAQVLIKLEGKQP